MFYKYCEGRALFCVNRVRSFEKWVVLQWDVAFGKVTFGACGDEVGKLVGPSRRFWDYVIYMKNPSVICASATISTPELVALENNKPQPAPTNRGYRDGMGAVNSVSFFFKVAPRHLPASGGAIRFVITSSELYPAPMAIVFIKRCFFSVGSSVLGLFHIIRSMRIWRFYFIRVNEFFPVSSEVRQLCLNWSSVNRSLICGFFGAPNMGNAEVLMAA